MQAVNVEETDIIEAFIHEDKYSIVFKKPDGISFEADRENLIDHHSRH